jgi:regulator of RNase E activity RraA
MASTQTDLKRMIAEYRMLSTANVSDGLDRLNLRGCPHGIGPLWDSCQKIVGRAATLKLVAVGEADENGVCVVPQDRMAEVLEFARLFKSIEDGIVEAVRSGVDPVEAHDRVRYDMMTKAGYKA